MPVENRGTKKNPRWRYAFTIRGVRYRRAIPEARTQYEAERAEVEGKKAVFDGRYGRPTGERDFRDFIEKVYLPWSRENKRSWRSDRSNARVVCEWFKGKTFVEVSPLLIEKFKKAMRESTTKRGTLRSARSVNEFLELLSSIFRLAIREKEVETNPCSQVKKLPLFNKRKRYVLDWEEPLLFAQFTGPRAHLKTMVTVAIGTGMRRSDHLPLRVSKVDFQRNCIWVPNSKTGNDYAIPMNEDVRRVMLEQCRDKAPNDYVFTNPKTGLPYTDLKKAFNTACRLAGISNLHWHDLRHTFGTRLGEAGYNAYEIMELMGHSEIETSLRYVHPTTERKQLWSLRDPYARKPGPNMPQMKNGCPY